MPLNHLNHIGRIHGDIHTNFLEGSYFTLWGTPAISLNNGAGMSGFNGIGF